MGRYFGRVSLGASILLLFAAALIHAGSYDGYVVYQLAEYSGNQVLANDPAVGYGSILPTDQDRLEFLKTGLSGSIENISLLPKLEAYRKILSFAVNSAITNGIPEHRIDAAYGGGVPVIRARESDISTILRAFDRTDIRWTFARGPSEAEKKIGADIAPVLQRRQAQLTTMISHTLEAVLPHALHQVDFDAILSNQALNERLGGWKDAPKRIFLDDGRVNLAQMSGAESEWTEQISSLRFSLKQITERIATLKNDPIEKGTLKIREYDDAVEKLTRHYDVRDGIDNPSPDPFGEGFSDRLFAWQKTFTQAASTVLRSFCFDARHSLRQWTHLDPLVLFPLYSFGLYSAMEYLENYDGFRPDMYGNGSMEKALFHLLEPFVNEDFAMEKYSEGVLIRISRLADTHPLIPLAGFAILERHLGGRMAEQLTHMSPKLFSRLYSVVGERIVLSPTVRTTLLEPNIDYNSDYKLNVGAIMNLVARTALEKGFSRPALAARAEIYDSTKKSIFDTAGERVFKRIQPRGIKERNP